MDEVTPGIALGAQMVGDREGRGPGGIEQGVFEQDRLIAAQQLRQRFGSIAEAEGEVVGDV